MPPLTHRSPSHTTNGDRSLLLGNRKGSGQPFNLVTPLSSLGLDLTGVTGGFSAMKDYFVNYRCRLGSEYEYQTSTYPTDYLILIRLFNTYP